MNTVLAQRISEDKLPSPLLLVGPKQTIHIELAKELVKKLFGEKHHAKIHSGNHPDIHVYSPEGKSGVHPVANMQKLIAEMAFPPFEAPYSVFILEDAEKMLPASSNALLKTLEEPSPTSFLILMTEHPEHLLPTVRSRLHLLNFPSIATQKIPETGEKIVRLMHLAKEGIWEQFFKEIPALEAASSDSVLENILCWVRDQKIPHLYFAELIDEAQKALRHNVKWRNVLVHVLVKIGMIQRNFPTHPSLVRSVEK